MKNLYITAILLLLTAILPAQEVAISYEVIPETENQSSIQLYLHSLTDKDQSIKAINFSFALPVGCVEVTGKQGVFSETWTDFLEEIKVQEGLDLNYNNWHYAQRWQYGNADPGLPNTTAVIAPAKTKAPLMIMEIQLKGSCADKLYLEQQMENRVNQMGDGDVLPIAWTVIHPKTDLALQEGLSLEIFPNPVQDDLNLHFEGIRDQSYQIVLSTIDGKRLQAKELQTQATGDLRFNMSNLPSAVYILSISKGSGETLSVGNMRILKK